MSELAVFVRDPGGSSGWVRYSRFMSCSAAEALAEGLAEDHDRVDWMVAESGEGVPVWLRMAGW